MRLHTLALISTFLAATAAAAPAAAAAAPRSLDAVEHFNACKNDASRETVLGCVCWAAKEKMLRDQTKNERNRTLKACRRGVFRGIIDALRPLCNPFRRNGKLQVEKLEKAFKRIRRGCRKPCIKNNDDRCD